MDIVYAIILGIIQGLTEFLPVSSSGHIELAQAILGTNYNEFEEQFSVVVHAATALSTIVVFRKDIAEILRGLLEFKDNEAWQFTKRIIISMIPAVIIGVVFEEQLKALFQGQILLVGIMLLVTSALLFLADKAKVTGKGVTIPDAFIIGLAQALAILPGLSRSGATISTSVLRQVDRGKAARFSFLMVVPLILGKMAKDILDGEANLTADLMPEFLAAFLAAFITGIIACTWMIQLVKRSKLGGFAIYCAIVGIIAIVWSLTQQ